MTTYRERREARAERLELWAEKREQKAAADYAQARTMGDAIPFGQPILVGHHSERRDRNYRARINRTYERAFEHAKKAHSMASRAENIAAQLDAAIYDDDPDAIERLTERIATLEARRERYKAENAAYRKAHKAELAALSPYERSQRIPHASYELSNLGGRITKDRQRLNVIRRQHARAERAEANGGVDVVRAASGYCTVTFAEKPDRSVLDALKAAGYRWAKGSWVGRTDQLPEGIDQ